VCHGRHEMTGARPGHWRFHPPAIVVYDRDVIAFGDRMPSSPAPPTYLLEGRYLAERLIARGETADVFAGTDTWSGEAIAIRRLRTDRPERARDFGRMSERLFGAASPRLLRAIHIGEDRDGTPFLVTDLLVGRDVQSLGMVRWEVATEVTRQAAAAVAEMHVLGLHHGALQSSTFFVAAVSAGGSRVRLLDLGIGDRHATAQKDVRALVSILHRLLLGKPSMPPIERPTPFRLNITGAPPALEDALAHWLSVEAEGLTAAEMATELKAISEAAHTDFWTGARAATTGPRVMPHTSMIMLDAADPSDPDE
jgi:hypothetical protein